MRKQGVVLEQVPAASLRGRHELACLGVGPDLAVDGDAPGFGPHEAGDHT